MEEEKPVTNKAFQGHLLAKKYPAQHEVLTILEHHTILKERGAKKVRDKVVNMIRKRK